MTRDYAGVDEDLNDCNTSSVSPDHQRQVVIVGLIVIRDHHRYTRELFCVTFVVILCNCVWYFWTRKRVPNAHERSSFPSCSGVTTLQNAAARLITGARRRYHITSVLRQLHWLPVRRRVEFKLACLVRQALCGHWSLVRCLPTWLMISVSSLKATDGPSGLPLTTCVRCHVRSTHNSFRDRSFGAAGPRIWNSLPRGLRTLDISYKQFKTLLKTYMFD